MIMPQATHIQWTDLSSNPIAFREVASSKRGWHCEKVSTGCIHCYAETLNKRFGTKLDFAKHSTPLVEPFLVESELRKLARIKWPKRVFVCDMTDIFGDFIDDTFRDAVFCAMVRNLKHGRKARFQVLTKRPKNAVLYFDSEPDRRGWWLEQLGEFLQLGVSVENQEQANKRIPELLKIPEALLFLSMEPLLGPADIAPWLASDDSEARIRWVIAGGESGRNARATNVAWVRSIKSQCKAAGVPFYLKQLGASVLDCQPETGWPDGTRIDGHRVWLKDQKGGDMNEWPADLRVREFPR